MRRSHATIEGRWTSCPGAASIRCNSSIDCGYENESAAGREPWACGGSSKDRDAASRSIGGTLSRNGASAGSRRWPGPKRLSPCCGDVRTPRQRERRRTKPAYTAVVLGDGSCVADSLLAVLGSPQCRPCPEIKQSLHHRSRFC